jgi:hypothetical protein
MIGNLVYSGLAVLRSDTQIQPYSQVAKSEADAKSEAERFLTGVMWDHAGECSAAQTVG